ncbi:MAG TPA: substrate-binding domain-containing protein [Vicinamibacterales bacterium]|nr:substrate-binding domain-containing protein [Vicinamibacterales bacterium]
MRRGWTLLGALTCAAALLAAAAYTSAPRRVLRVCADPNNLPFSNDRGEGFENRLAELVAREMKAGLRYTWWAQRRGFVRNTLKAGECDVIMGIPSSYELARATRPYYRSSYTFVYPKASGLAIASLDDPRLRELRIGVHVIGDDYANVPPAHALAARGIIANVVGYSIFGNYAEPNPPARLIEAAAHGEIDLAIAWGPLAGYVARQQPVAMEVVPVTPEIDLPFLPFVYDISMGVRREDVALQQELDAILVRRADEIDALLDEFGIPYARRIRYAAAPEAAAPGRLP